MRGRGSEEGDGWSLKGLLSLERAEGARLS